MELAQITAGQVVMLFLLMGTGMLLAAGDLGCIVRSKPVWKLAAVHFAAGSVVLTTLLSIVALPLCALVVTLL